MWPAFFARVRPVTRNAKPTCMKSTRKPVSSSQVKLIEIAQVPGLVGQRVACPACESGTFVIARVVGRG